MVSSIGERAWLEHAGVVDRRDGDVTCWHSRCEDDVRGATVQHCQARQADRLHHCAVHVDAHSIALRVQNGQRRRAAHDVYSNPETEQRFVAHRSSSVAWHCSVVAVVATATSTATTTTNYVDHYFIIFIVVGADRSRRWSR